jgi:hypothetical protein
MAKVTIIIEDAGEGVEVSAQFDPELPEELTEEILDQLSEAQLFGLEILDYIEQGLEEDEA